MPSKILRTRRRLSLYLIPVVLGICGILFARGIEAPVLRGVVLLLSVAGPMVAGAYILANLSVRLAERTLLVGGILLLMMGALATASDISGVLGSHEGVRRQVQDFSQWMGLVSLLLGMLALLASIVRTDEAIEEIGARFRHLADQMGEGFVLAAADGTIALINQRLLELTGLSQREVLGHKVREVAGRLNGEVILPHLEEGKQGLAKEYECSWALSGEERHFLISSKPLYNRRGRLAGMLATVRDITEQRDLARRLERYTHGLQKLVEDRTQKLRQSEEQFRDLLLSMNEGFLTADGRFRIRFVNDRICDVLRLRPPALIGREVFDFVDAAGRGRLLDLFGAVRAGDTPHMTQEFVFVSEGVEIPVMVAVAPVHVDPIPEGLPDDEPRYSLVVTDIGELKRMQRQLEMRANELQAANEELQMLDRAKDGFLSNVTHELKTPLATIRGYVEMLETGGLGELRPAQSNALTIMGRNVQRLGLLIEEMIEFSRMQIRGIQLSMNLFSIRGLVSESVSSVKPQAAGRNLQVGASIADDVSEVWADRKRIAQVVSILLSNAAKFSHPGGCIDVVVARRREKDLALAVVDRGIGIPTALQERVFDKFYQVDSSHTRRYEGTGIGLSIAKSIAEAHGGRIELESAPGIGSTFTLVLPHAVFDARAALDSAAKDERFASLRIILADDEEESRWALSDVLTRAGCQVHNARSGYECVRMARDLSANLVILDEVLPDLSGVAAFQKLREEIDLSPVPVLLLGRPNALEAGFDDLYWLPKPFSAIELLGKVREAYFHEEPPAAVEKPETGGNGIPGRASVLAIDTDADFLEWLETGLRLRHIDCCSALDVNEALGVAGARRPDIILMDVDGSNGGAPDIVARLRQAPATKGIPIYVLTGMPAEYYQDLGVAGAFKKPFPLTEVVELVLGSKAFAG